MAISASQVMELRSATGAGMMDCKKALEEVGGDMDAAKDYLRKKGISIARKKSSRETNEGGIAIRLSPDRRAAAMVQLACETDFVARNEQFGALLGVLTEQVLAAGDRDVPAQALPEGKGTVADLITENIGKMGENLQLVEAVRLSLDGEGVLGGYVHSNSRIGVLLALRGAGPDAGLGAGPDAGETLETLARDIAMHIAASQVNSVSGDDLDPAVLEKEKEILTAQALESGKPADIAAKMVEGRLRKFVKEVTLLEQPFVKDPEQTVRQRVAEVGRQLGAGLTVERFVKFQF
jgi:elongation factor Ts